MKNNDEENLKPDTMKMDLTNEASWPVSLYDDLRIAQDNAEEKESCKKCGCGFVAKYDDGYRICLFCLSKWNIEKKS